MIDVSLMNLKIKNKEVEVLKVNERISNGFYVKTVKLNDQSYKLCPGTSDHPCGFYQTLEQFTWIKSSNAYHTLCKTCRRKKTLEKYYTDPKTHIYTRWRAINRSIKKEDKCTLEEFSKFFYEAKCAYTGRTLYEEFIEPTKNPNLRLVIDHIRPVSKGGSSRIENLQVIPKVINVIKQDVSHSEYRETLEFLTKFASSRK